MPDNLTRTSSIGLQDLTAEKQTLVLTVSGFPPNVHRSLEDMVVENPPEWELAQTCYQCRCTFGLLMRRRHHCRHCGKSFCCIHSNRRLVLQHLGYEKPERVCEGCYKSYVEASLDYSNYLKKKTASMFYDGANWA